MGFDIQNLHIDEASPAGRIVERIIRREGVSPEEAVRRALARAEEGPRPEDIVGAFSSPEDVALIDEVMESVREMRERNTRQPSSL